MKLLRSALCLFVLLSLLVGGLYPALTTLVGKILFPHQASGSLIVKGGKTVGSELIEQNFTQSKYFWGRPSATVHAPCNAMASNGSNLGPLNPSLVEKVKANVQALQKADPQNQKAIPVDLVTASGSGLDPHISLAGALYQVDRVAHARGMDPKVVEGLVKSCTEQAEWGFIGHSWVNVLKLNLLLDAQS